MFSAIGELFFSNIGEKIKKLAVISTLFGTIISVALGCVGYVIVDDMFDEGAWIAIVVAVIGAIISWVSSFLLYGFGELIELSGDMSYMLATLKEERDRAKVKKEKVANKEIDPETIAMKRKLDIWREKGMISEKDYLERLEMLKKTK